MSGQDFSKYKDLLKTQDTNGYDKNVPRKRRKRDPVVNQEAIQANAGHTDSSADEFEDVDLDEFKIDTDVVKVESNEVNFFDLNCNYIRDPDKEVVSVAIENPEPIKKSRHRPSIIDKDERLFRSSYHKTYLALMLYHGQWRNMWCNNRLLKTEMIQMLPKSIVRAKKELYGSTKPAIVQHRKLLDLLNLLLRFYRFRFRISGQGLIRKNWNELSIPQNRVEKNVDLARFQQLVLNFRGSRDIAIQGFVALCRTLGLATRLVFSIQTPDYTCTAKLPPIDVNIEKGEDSTSANGMSTSLESPDAFKKDLSSLLTGTARFLEHLRSSHTTTSNLASRTREPKRFEESCFPIFWAEVWSIHIKKWISVDPIVLETIESAPMRRKSKFEPPLLDPRNQLTYAIAYDANGKVTDVTRRYSQYYIARTMKKRIQFRSEQDKEWYSNLLRKVSILTALTKRDIYEKIEFRNRDLAEGMPNNLSDFKHHPTYALESQLAKNEAIFPNDKTSKCGTFRNKSLKSKDSNVITVYKRSCVFQLRSARAWYMRGRVLKVGAQPLKIAAQKSSSPTQHDKSDDTTSETRNLYAEFQTRLVIPPKILNGVIPKNAYGNIDIFIESMLPDGACLIPVTETYSIKMLENAARLIQVDFARAITAFDFKKGSGLGKRVSATAREGGIVVPLENQDAINAVLQGMAEDEASSKQQRMVINSISNWHFFLKKLRIVERLNNYHGHVRGTNENYGSGKNKNDDEYTLNLSTHTGSSDSTRHSNVRSEAQAVNVQQNMENNMLPNAEGVTLENLSREARFHHSFDFTSYKGTEAWKLGDSLSIMDDQMEENESTTDILDWRGGFLADSITVRDGSHDGITLKEEIVTHINLPNALENQNIVLNRDQPGIQESCIEARKSDVKKKIKIDHMVDADECLEALGSESDANFEFQYSESE